MNWLNTFPNQNGGVVTALLLILLTGIVVIGRLALGLPYPAGYDPWLVFLATLSGVGTVGMIGKRATDIDLAKAKNPASSVTVSTEPSPTTTTVTTVQPVVLPDTEKDERVERPKYAPGGIN